MIFFIVHRFNIKSVSKLRLIELLHAGKKNETIKENTGRDSVIFVISLALLAAGYVWIFNNRGSSLFSVLGWGVLLIVSGTFCFFFSIAGLLLKFLSQKNDFYYRGLNMFVLRQLSSRIKSANFSIAVISILLTFSVSAMAVGMGMGKYLTHVLKKDFIPDAYQAEKMEHNAFSDNYGVMVIGVEDYNRAMAQQGMEEIVLKEDEFAINYDRKENKENLEYYLAHQNDPVSINGYFLSPAKDGLRRGISP